MLKRRLISLFAISLAATLQASQLDDALATAGQLQSRIGASSSISSPSINSFQSAEGDAGALKALAQNLASQLQGLNLGPVSGVQSASADLEVKISTLQGTTVLNVNAFISACRDTAASMNNLNGLLPGLISALQGEQGRLSQIIQNTTHWTPPTAVPNPADPGHFWPTPTPVAGWNGPGEAGPTPVPPIAVPTLPPSGSIGLIPGGPQLPPLPPAVNTPTPPMATPTPRPALKAPVSLLVVGEGDDDRMDASKVYVANVNAGSIGVLDLGLKRVVRQIAVGAQPVALAQGASTVIVANFGSANVSLIDSGMDAVVATLSVGSQPVDVAVTDGKAYVVNQGSNSVSVIDLEHRRAGKNISVGQQPSRIRIQGGRAYVSNTNEDSVTIIDTRIDDAIATVSE